MQLLAQAIQTQLADLCRAVCLSEGFDFWGALTAIAVSHHGGVARHESIARRTAHAPTLPAIHCWDVRRGRPHVFARVDEHGIHLAMSVGGRWAKLSGASNVGGRGWRGLASRRHDVMSADHSRWKIEKSRKLFWPGQ